MLGLTVKQPWTYAIFHLGKDIENRNWKQDVSGRVAIQASKTISKYEFSGARNVIFNYMRPGVMVPPMDQYTVGAIVGTVEVTGYVTKSESPWFLGKYGFVLQDPILLPEPIPFVGMLGFWTVPEDIEAQIKEQLR